MQSETIDQIATALAAAQAEIQDPHKSRTGKVSGTTKAGKYFEYEYKYADLAEVLKNVRAALAKHGIAVSQPTVVEDSTLLVQTRLMHSSGQWISSDYPVCSISGDHQKMGAALTYAKRYALTSMVGVAADEDTDGQGAAEVEAPKGRPKRTMAEISAHKKWKEKTLEEIQHDLSEIESEAALQRYERDVLTPDTMNRLGMKQYVVEEEVQALRDRFGAAAEDDPQEVTNSIFLLSNLREALKLAKTAKDLTAWANEPSTQQTVAELTEEDRAAFREDYADRLTILKDEAGQKRPTRSDKPYAGSSAEMRDKGGELLHPLHAG